MKNKMLFILLPIIAILSLASVWYLALPGFPVTDDGNWMIIRFSAFYQALSEGQFPVRFLSRLNFGFGYPVANFLYPLFMYLAVPFKLVGFTFVDSIKIIIAFSMIASGAFTFLWLRKHFDDFISALASLFYVFTPYHLYDVLRRGSVGELLSLAIVPFILWRIDEDDITLTSLGIAALILSHNTLALLFLPLIIVYALLIRARGIKRFAASIILGLGISAFFWIPSLIELSYTRFSQTEISDASEYITDINLIGVIGIVVLISCVLMLAVKRKDFFKNKPLLMFLILGFTSAFFASEYASILWKFIPTSFIQFPFRLLSLTILCYSFVFAFVISEIPSKLKYVAGGSILAIMIVLNYSLLIPAELVEYDDSYYSTNEATTTVRNEYMPLWVRELPVKHFGEKVATVKGEAEISNISYNSRSVTFKLSSDKPSVSQISTIYYPGWTARANGQDKAIFSDNNKGLMEVKLPSGQFEVELFFGETPLRLASDLLSVGSLGVVVYLKLRNRSSTLKDIKK